MCGLQELDDRLAMEVSRLSDADRAIVGADRREASPLPRASPKRRQRMDTHPPTGRYATERSVVRHAYVWNRIVVSQADTHIEDPREHVHVLVAVDVHRLEPQQQHSLDLRTALAFDFGRAESPQHIARHE